MLNWELGEAARYATAPGGKIPRASRTLTSSQCLFLGVTKTFSTFAFFTLASFYNQSLLYHYYHHSLLYHYYQHFLINIVAIKIIEALLLLLLLPSFISCFLFLFKEFVANIRQNYEEEINKKLIEQIQKELSASYIYQGYVSYLPFLYVNEVEGNAFFKKSKLTLICLKFQ